MLSKSIEDAAGAARQIAASSEQQVAGMIQVAQAMESIRQGSEQNTVVTRQAENAAHNLNELGQKLQKLVERYQV
jgi:methyl-accepting chemotaxis protein